MKQNGGNSTIPAPPKNDPRSFLSLSEILGGVKFTEIRFKQCSRLQHPRRGFERHGPNLDEASESRREHVPRAAYAERHAAAAQSERAQAAPGPRGVRNGVDRDRELFEHGLQWKE